MSLSSRSAPARPALQDESARFLYLAPWLRSEPRESLVAGLLAGIAANAHERESALLFFRG